MIGLYIVFLTISSLILNHSKSHENRLYICVHIKMECITPSLFVQYKIAYNFEIFPAAQFFFNMWVSATRGLIMS